MSKTQLLSSDVVDLAEEHGVADQLEAILEITEQMFPGPLRVEIDADPEWPSDRYITFVVEVTGTMKDFIRKQSKWRERVQSLIPECPPGVVGLSFF